MDIALSVVTNIVSKLVDTAIRQARYSFQFNKYVNDLEKEKVNLQLKIESTIGRAQEAKKKTEKIVSVVDDWLSKADSLMAQVLEMEEKAKKRNKATCLKCCPNWVSRYGLAKKLEEKINEVIEHNKKDDFPEFSRLATLIGMNYFSSEAFVHFNSRKGAFDGLLEALKDDKVHMIGLWGMGGCGKTTLVKEVSKEAEKFFDKVVFVTVSNTNHVRNIQGNIASQLGKLELKEEEEPERARRLFMRLNGGERLLIILDDVWRKLDFEAIGIPIGENKNGCTVLITTRYRHVCTSMNCQSMIALDLLNMEEALTLFQKHARLFDDNSETLKLKGLAEEITKECGGLPVAIAAVASTLKGKTQVEWEEALETLRDSSPMDIEEGLKNPYTCLQLSFDNLKNEVAKSLFLLCSVFPEDYEIVIDDLAIFGIALGVVGETHTFKRARNQVSIAINKLVDSCLLLGATENGVISMHDLVRDVALWIAKNENKIIMGPERSQKVLNVDMILKDNTIRYLWLEEVDKFPHRLDCPNLEFLHMSINSESLVDVTNELLDGIKKLRVLFLKNSFRGDQALQLPKSIHSINNLRCLLLFGWRLGDISLLGSLERLVILKLSFCSFDELPNSMPEQKNLRLLQVAYCTVKRNPYEVIGRCSQLEELYFYHTNGEDLEYKDENVVEFFDKISATLPLERYNLNIGECYGSHLPQLDSSTIARLLSVDYFESCISNETIRDLMKRANALSLARINSYKSIVPDIVQRIGGDLNELTILDLYDSDGIECVIDIPNHLAFGLVRIISNLTHLTLSGMEHLKTLYNGHPPQGLFANLEILHIAKCNSLEHLIADEVEEIVLDYSLSFPNLQTLSIRECNQLEYLFPVSFTQSFPQLNHLTIEGAAKLKTIFGQSNYKDQNPNEFQIIEFSALKEIILYDLPNVNSICSENYCPRWPSLESLHLRKCPQLTSMSVSNHNIPCSGLTQDHTETKDVMRAKEINLEKLKTVMLRNFKVDVLFYLEGQQINSSLQKLLLEDVLELRHIWVGPKNLLQLQNLGSLDIRKCEILKVVFPTTISRSFPQLRELIIMDCKELEEIIEEDQNVSNPQLLFPNLTIIIIRHCHKLKCVFPVSTSHVLPKLKVLWIEEASQLEQVFGNEEEKMEGVMIPNLKYVLLMKLPKLKMGPQWIGLQTATYCLVQDCQHLNFTSSIASLEEFHKLCKIVIDLEMDYDVWDLYLELEEIIKSKQDFSSEINKQFDNVEIEDEAVLFEDFFSQMETNQNNSGTQSEKELTPIASPKLNESQNKTTKKTVGEVPALEKPIAMATSSTNPEFELDNDEVLLGTKRIERNFKEGFSSENAKTVISLIHSEPAQSLPTPSLTSLPGVFPLSQINIKQTETDIDKDTEPNPLINHQDFENDDGEIQISSVVTIKNDFVEKVLSDLEVSMKFPLKDIAISEANTLHILTLLNFLSRLSIEDGAFPQGLRAIVKSLHQDLPSILYSFKPALAVIKKFHEAQEKEARLMALIFMREKEIEDCEAKLSSLQEQKRTCDAEATEFKKEYESVMKEIDEMGEDQRKTWQQLFDVDYKWSVLYSQFQQKDIDVHTRQIIHSTFENVIESNEDSSRETTKQINNKETEVQAASESDHLLEQKSAHVAAPNLIESDQEVEDEDQSVQEGNILEETSIVKGNIEEGSTSTSKNTEAFLLSQININQSVPIAATTKDELVTKNISDMEVSLKMPLKDIATSKANSLRLLTALNFLSCLSSDDGALPHELKAIIDSLHQDLPSILCYFKSACAKINKFSKFMDEAQEKEVKLKEHISRLENEIKECDAKLSSFEKKKKKYVAETIELKKEFESAGLIFIAMEIATAAAADIVTLNEEEAWALFQKHVEFSDDSLKSVAKEITKECCGLPVAIAAVASTLNGKEQFEWEEALKTLKDSNLLEIEEGLQSPYACLELSYKQLKNEVARSLFLLCSVFPEDYEISSDLLTIIGIGLGLVEEFQSYTRARNIVRKAKNKFTDSCLLLKVDEEVNEVKMHDLVRDAALWIANKEGKLIMGPEKSHKVLSEDMIMKDSWRREKNGRSKIKVLLNVLIKRAALHWN
ncbi:Disease resistance protein [Senna tora]|uniref:Disease resistance protein n=1 Tax=Senna tora TaxID=362788 RepID=A0A835C8W9_9FABA|nr:Disease resistance protein [Senna tora]